MNSKYTMLKAAKSEISSATSIDELVAAFERYLSSTTEKQRKKGLGRTSYVVTVKGQEVETCFRLVEVNDLIPSNTIDGRINPEFPQSLQPRDRTRQSSILQVNKMASNIRPAQLTDSGLSSHGAPIVGRDLVVESGNGRTMALIKAYRDGKADKYKNYLIDNAEMFGFQRSRIESMKQPVLVRERITELDRAKFARDSNLNDLQQMSAAESAFVDAERIDDNMMQLFSPGSGGNLLSRDNQPFIRAFLNELGDQDTAGLLTSDGRPTKQLLDRMQNAIFAKAYKQEKLVKLVSEEPDPEIRNVLTALNNAASLFVEMQYLSGEAHKQVSSDIADAVEDIAGNGPSLADEALEALVSAANMVREAKETGQHIDEYIAQGSLFGEANPNAEALARFISLNNRSAKRMGEAFKMLAEEINAVLLRQGQAIGDMFGESSPDLVEILAKVSDYLDKEYNTRINHSPVKGGNGMLFESANVRDKLSIKFKRFFG